MLRQSRGYVQEEEEKVKITMKPIHHISTRLFYDDHKAGRTSVFSSFLAYKVKQTNQLEFHSTHDDGAEAQDFE